MPHRVGADSEDKWQCAVRSQQINLVRGCSQQQLQVYVIFYRLLSRQSPPSRPVSPPRSCSLSWPTDWLTYEWRVAVLEVEKSRIEFWDGVECGRSSLLSIDKSVCISNWIHERALDTSTRTFISPHCSWSAASREQQKSLALTGVWKRSHKILISAKSEGNRNKK